MYTKPSLVYELKIHEMDKPPIPFSNLSLCFPLRSNVSRLESKFDILNLLATHESWQSWHSEHIIQDTTDMIVTTFFRALQELRQEYKTQSHPIIA